jgi:hypothetical protein
MENAMNIDMQQHDNRVPQNDDRALGDDELCLVQGGGNLVDLAMLLLKAVSNALHWGNGRPQV